MCAIAQCNSYPLIERPASIWADFRAFIDLI
jgi:hypothetical protein